MNNPNTSSSRPQTGLGEGGGDIKLKVLECYKCLEELLTLCKNFRNKGALLNLWDL
jgi:hypothetical protein